VRETLYQGRSAFQRIEVHDTLLFGRMLVLDGMIQTTERDEFFYHEMLVHPAMLSHPKPRSALLVGGGDGGALRRVLEHGVQHVTMVEIDRAVVDVSREYLPSVSAGAFEDPRVELLYEDGYAFVRRREHQYDVVVVDAPDPIGPGKQLFSEDFYNALLEVTAPGGVVALQSESPLLMATQTATTYLHVSAAFSDARLYVGAVPAYPGVLWSFTLAAAAGGLPAKAEIESRYRARGLITNHYTPAVHEASFVLPKYLEAFLQDTVSKGIPSCRHPFFPAAQGQTVLEPSAT
jgi:spermidine synthase